MSIAPALFVIRKEISFLRPFVIQISRTEDDIIVRYIKRISVRGQIEDFTVFNFHLNRFELMKRVDWKDYTQHGIHFKDYDVDYMLGVSKLIDHFADAGMSREDIETAVPLHFSRYGTVNRNGYLINISAACLCGRITSLEGHAIVPAYRMLNFTMKFKDSKFTELAVNLAADPAVEVEILSGDRHFDILNSKAIYQDLAMRDETIKEQVARPKIKLLHIETDTVNKECPTDSYVWVGIQLIREWYGDNINQSAEIELEAVNGYLPKTRIILNDKGYGEFKFHALHLDPGDTMRVKAGFRYQPGMTDIEFKII